MVTAMSEEKRESAAQAQPSEDARVIARRHFLRAAIYAAPVVAGVVAVNHASAVVSCSSCATSHAYCVINSGECVPACVPACP